MITSYALLNENFFLCFENFKKNGDSNDGKEPNHHLIAKSKESRFVTLLLHQNHSVTRKLMERFKVFYLISALSSRQVTKRKIINNKKLDA